MRSSKASSMHMIRCPPRAWSTHADSLRVPPLSINCHCTIALSTVCPCALA
jgi:hypothetical protein